MPFLSYSQLKTPKTETVIMAEQLGVLQSYGFPVTSWQSGSIGRTLAQMNARELAELQKQIATIAENGFLSTATGVWLDAIGESHFSETRNQGQAAQGIVVLSDPFGNGPFTISSGDLWVSVGNGGQRFNNTQTVTVPSGGSVTCTVQAESLGAAYNAANNAITVVSSGFPGLVVSNPPISPVGGASVSVLSSATSNGAVYIQIISGGLVSSGLLNYKISTNGGFNFTGPLQIPASGIITVLGIPVTFTGTLAVGDTVTFDTYTGQPAYNFSFLSSLNTSNTWLTKAGTDIESDGEYRTRCALKWASITSGATSAYYEFWTRQASIEVTKVTAYENISAQGVVDVVIAGPAGSVPSVAVNAVYAMMQQRRPLTTVVNVINATPITVQITGTVYVRSANLLDAQSQVAAAFSNYTNELPIGGTVYFAEVVQRIMDCTGVNNVALTNPSLDIALSSSQVVVFNASSLNWIQI